MQAAVREVERELCAAHLKVEQLSEELDLATSAAHENSQESLTRLRQLQNELTSSSREREAVLKRYDTLIDYMYIYDVANIGCFLLS